MVSSFWRPAVQNESVGRSTLQLKPLGRNPSLPLLASGVCWHFLVHLALLEHHSASITTWPSSPLPMRTPVILDQGLVLGLATTLFPKRASLVAQLVNNPPAVWETWVRSLGWEDPLEKGKAIHSSILAWRIPWTAKSWTQLSGFHFHFIFKKAHIRRFWGVRT